MATLAAPHPGSKRIRAARDLVAALTEAARSVREELSGNEADEIAQTLVYGLYADSWRGGEAAGDPRSVLRAGGFSEECLRDCGRVVAAHAEQILSLLAQVDRAAVHRDCERMSHGGDAALYLYEPFLRAYDARARGAGGVYCTPGPVVSFIVRLVDCILPELTNGPIWSKVTVIDPACGTGAFLCGVADHIRDRLTRMKRPRAPRLIGIEKLAAPCAVAQLLLSRRLAEMPGSPSFCIRRADALADANLIPELLPEDWPIRVVIGNPPYSGISRNRAAWLANLLRGKMPDGSAGASYYHVDGRPLRERKLWLQDDYVKFMRLGQWILEKSATGILAFITNHAWLDNPTFRGMRHSLMQTFNVVHVFDLHGNANRKERCPDGSPDENVFDIQQGVAVAMFVKEKARRRSAFVDHADLWGSRQSKLERLERMMESPIRSQPLQPVAPQYFFVPRDGTLRKEYERGWKITEIMPVFTTGVVTARDGFVTDFDGEALLERIAEFRDQTLSDEEIRRKHFAGRGSPLYPPGDSRGWKLPEARRLVRADPQWRRRIVPYAYRPFDVRPLYHVPWMVDWPRPEVMNHLLAGENLALVTVRQVAEGRFNHAFVTDTIADGRLTLSNKGIAYVFPLQLYPAAPPAPWGTTPPGAMGKLRLPVRQGSMGRMPVRHTDDAEVGAMGMRSMPVQHAASSNICGGFIRAVTDTLKLRRRPATLDVFHYIYATLHSPDYASRYAEFLQSDFPRIPIPHDRERFRARVLQL